MPMRRYILLQYQHGERSDTASSVAGTFDLIQDAQAFAGKRLCNFNEIVDSNTWQVVWRLYKPSSASPTVAPLQMFLEPYGSDEYTSMRNW
jgi:hypothetical protein